MKKSFFSLLIMWVGMSFLLPTQLVKAADTCVSSYGGIGLSCAAIAGECNQSDDIKNKIETAFNTKKEGTLDKSKVYIDGVCMGVSVCCVKKPVPAAAGATGGTPAPTAPPDNKVKAWIETNYQAPEGYQGPIPKCAFSGQCRDTNDLVDLLIRQGKSVFGFIGMVALAAFVYGGFLMVFSFGSSDKVSQGKDVMVAAVIGIIIVFSAYLIVNFLLGALGVSTEFQAIK